MLHTYSFEDVIALVPSRFVRRLTTNRPKKVKHTLSPLSVQPNTCKSLERYLNTHTRPLAPRRRTPISNDVVFPPSNPFPFAEFYSIQGSFERSKAQTSLDFMLSKTPSPPAPFLVHLYIECVWVGDKNWKSLLWEKLQALKIKTFRAPHAIISAIRLNRDEVATELIKHSDPGGLKDVASAMLLDRNLQYLEKIVPLLNISTRNDVFFQGLSRLNRQPEYESLWRFLSPWVNVYKVASKMLYMRECTSADYLLSQPYVAMDVVDEAWRYVEKTGLEDEMPRTHARLLNKTLRAHLSDEWHTKDDDSGRRKI